MGTHPIFESDFDCLTEMEIVKQDLIETEYPVCSVEYDSLRGVVYTGSYQLLDGEKSERKGKIEKYKINEENKFEKNHQIETGAILDLKINESRVYCCDDRGQLSVIEGEKDEIVETVQVSSGLLMSISVSN